MVEARTPDERRRSLDERRMAYALELARRGAGHVSPNPMVGAVLVGPEGEVWGEGWHGRYGGPHAEVWAVRDAHRRGHVDLSAATLYVTLEPCSHWGKTPPCADLVVQERIGRVVVGMQDPFPKVAGGGLRRLREAGVALSVGVLERPCQRLTEAFTHHVRTGRPLVTLKWAQTLDGAVATHTGDSRWISSEQARALVHAWRAELDAVLVGAGTAAADDPALTVRHVEGRQPLRVVLDRTGALDPSLQLFTDTWAAQTVALVAEGITPPYAEAFAARGGTVVAVPERSGHLDLGAALAALGAGVGPHRPVQSVLVEAGPGLATALWRADLVDRLCAFVSPKLVGGGVPVVRALGVDAMAEARRFAEAAWEPVGPDVLLRGYVRAV